MAARKKVKPAGTDSAIPPVPDMNEWMKVWTLPLQQNPFSQGFSLPGLPPIPATGPNDWMKALSPDELRKRRQELVAVDTWLSMQQTALKTTMQLLDMQIAAFEALQPKTK